MAVNVAQFEFTCNITTGNQTIASGLGFTPTGYIVVSSLGTADATFGEGSGFLIVISDGTTTRSICTRLADNAGLSNTGYAQGNNIRIPTAATPGSTAEAIGTHSSFGSGTIVWNWSDAPQAAHRMYGIAFGGDIQCECKEFTVGATATGNRSYTTTMSNPQMAFFLTPDESNVGNTLTVAANISLGVALSTSKRGVLALLSENGQNNMDDWGLFDNTICVGCLNKATGAIQWKADFVSWNANGVTLNITDGPSSTAAPFYGLFLKGATFDFGTQAMRTSTGTTPVTTSGVGTVKGLMVMAHGAGVSSTVSSIFRHSIGFASSTTTQGCAGEAETDNVGTSQPVSRSEDSNVLTIFTDAATATSSTMTKLANISAMGTDSFTLNYTTANATAMDLFWLAIGESASLTQVSATKTHKYDVIGKVSRSKTHKWNIIAVVTRSKTHKFNIFKIVSLTRTHKYNILQKITQSKTHKYNIIGKITATKTHKYNIIGKITQTKTHKYNILTSVSTNKSHLYNILTSLSVSKTHKYSLLNTVSQSKTHKFSILTSLSLSKTHKYNILEQVVKAAVHVYNVIGKVVESNTHKYDVIGKITTTKTHKYNILQSVSASKTHEYNILNAATTTKTHVYNILEAASTSKTHLYNITGYITKTKTHIFDVIGKITTSKTHKYNIIATITKSTTHKYNIISPVAAVSKTHKYNIESDTTVSTTKTHKFNILQGVTKSKTHIYNIVEAVSTIKTHVYNVIGKITSTKTHKYNVIQEVEAQKTHAFSVLETLSVSKTHIFNILEAVTLTKTHKYNIIGKITASKTHIYDVDSAVTAVSTTKTHKYDVNAATTPISTTKTHLFDILQRISTLKTHEYNILQGAVKTKTHKFNIIIQITQSKTHKFNIIAKLTVTKSHIYNILQKITTVTKTHRYNIVNLVGPRTRTHKYNVIGRITTTKTHKYGLGGKVSTTKTHRYQLGAIIFRELGGSTHALIRFPERVTVIDILGDINNKVVANIEISPIHQQNNRVIAVVQITEYPFNILTAETHKPRHRIASSLILPPIIDKIENRAIAPYIGIQSIESTPESQIHLKSALRMEKTPNPSFYVTSKTQIRQDEKSIIKVSGALSLKDKDRVVSTASIIISPNLQLNKIVIPEIMSLEQEKTIKTIIKLLKTDDLFE